MGATSPRSIGSYLALVRAHWLVASLAFLATLAGAVAYLQLRSEAYEATAEVLVTPVPADTQGLLALPLITEAPDATRVSQTAAALLRNSEAAESVVPALPDDWDRDRVLRSLAIEPRGESNVIAVTATADAAGLAARLANGYTEASLDARDAAVRADIPGRVDQLRDQLAAALSVSERDEAQRRIAALRSIQQSGDPTLSLSQSATPPTVSSSPGLGLVLGAAIAVGLALAFGAALVMSLVDKRVGDEDDLTQLSSLPVLARVPDSTKPHARAVAAEGFRTLLAQLDALEPRASVVMLTSASSGDGKTSSALQLAYAAREAGRRVILLGFDLRKPFDAAAGGRRGRQNPLHRFPSDVEAGLRADSDGPLAENLSRSTDPWLAFALADTSDPAARAAVSRRMPDLVNEARGLADLVIVDTAPLGEVGDALPLLEHVDAVVLVARLGVTARSSFARMGDLIHRAGIARRGGPLGILLIGETSEPASPYYRELAGAAVQR